MAVEDGRVTAKALWACSARRSPNDRSSSPDSGKSGSGKAARKRASKPKVRTGCLSCKRRHLKCDERKDGGCFRCESFGIPCEGYALPKTVKETKPARVERPLLPRPKPTVIAAATKPASLAPAPAITVSVAPGSTPPVMAPFAACSVEPGPIPLLRSPSFVMEWSDDDNYYWSAFQHEIVRSLSPYFESNFWKRLSVREGLLNDCIRHSILSIGAYSRAITTAREESRLREDHTQHPSWIDTRRTKHHRAALHHHDKALGHLRQKMGSSLSDTRLTMIATLLFIAFENMQGNYHASGSLIRSGIKVLGATAVDTCIDATLLHETLQLPGSGLTPSLPGPPLPPTSPSSSLHPSPRVSPSPIPPSSPDPSLPPAGDPDDENVAELAQMFARLSTACVYLPFPHCKFAYHLLLDPRLTDPITNRYIASYPTTLDQARAAWDFYLPILGNFFHKAIWHNLNHAYEFDFLDAAREQSEHLAWLRRFGAVLELLRIADAGGADAHVTGRRCGGKPGQDGTSPLNKGLEMLTIHHLVATIFTTCCLDNTEMLYDAFMPQFEEILARCQVFVADVAAQEAQDTAPGSHRSPKIGFSNDTGLLPLLGFVVSKCRNRAIRVEAIKLIGEYDCREGSWDSRSLVNGMLALMSLEQMGMDMLTGQIPATARFVWSNCCWDSENRSMTMQFTRVLPSESGEYQKRELTAGL